MSGPGSPCGSDIPSILELQLRKSIELTSPEAIAKWAENSASLPLRPNSNVWILRELPINQPDESEYEDALKRVKKLLAETREMVVRAEALVASLRSPRDYYAQADGS